MHTLKSWDVSHKFEITKDERTKIFENIFPKVSDI